MRHSRRHGILVALLLLPAVASAQTGGATSAGSAVDARPGDRVLVTMDDGRDLVGHIRTITSDCPGLEVE